jgi:hypothetical protein
MDWERSIMNAVLYFALALAMISCTVRAVNSLPDPDRDAKLFQSVVPGLPIPSGRVGGAYREVGWPEPKSDAELAALQRQIELEANAKFDAMIRNYTAFGWLCCMFGVIGGCVLIAYEPLRQMGKMIAGGCGMAMAALYFLGKYVPKLAEYAFWVGLAVGVLGLAYSVFLLILRARRGEVDKVQAVQQKEKVDAALTSVVHSVEAVKAKHRNEWDEQLKWFFAGGHEDVIAPKKAEAKAKLKGASYAEKA